MPLLALLSLVGILAVMVSMQTQNQVIVRLAMRVVKPVTVLIQHAPVALLIPTYITASVLVGVLWKDTIKTQRIWCAQSATQLAVSAKVMPQTA